MVTTDENDVVTLGCLEEKVYTLSLLELKGHLRINYRPLNFEEGEVCNITTTYLNYDRKTIYDLINHFNSKENNWDNLLIVVIESKYDNQLREWLLSIANHYQINNTFQIFEQARECIENESFHGILENDLMGNWNG